MAAYLTRSDALLRLEAYGLTAEQSDVVMDPDLLAASDELDEMAPFKGLRPEDQDRQFPRADEETIPDAILNWVALRAYQVAANLAPPVKSTGAGKVSVTYERAKPHAIERRLEHLLDPYLEPYGNRGYYNRVYLNRVPRGVTWRAL